MILHTPVRGLPHLLSSRRFSSSTSEYDVCVIGGGPGGYVCAIRAAQLGLKTICVEKRKTLGGTCLNVGCIPSKALLNSSQKFADLSGNSGKSALKKMGIKMSAAPELDLQGMMSHKDRIVSSLCKGIEGLFKKYGVEAALGEPARLKGKEEVEVGGRTIRAKRIVLASGSEINPALPSVGWDGKFVVSSDEAISLSSVPKNLVVIGGGVIGLELGSVWSRLGAKVRGFPDKVHILEASERVLMAADKEVALAAAKIFQKQGMTIHTQARVQSVEEGEGGGDGKVKISGVEEALPASKVLLCIGRRPVSKDLNLQAAGVEVDSRGRVEVSSSLRTSSPSIFAIGDLVKGPMLAHKAEDDGHMVAEMIHEELKRAGGAEEEVDYSCVPSVVYTHPEIAWVGKTEEQLKEEGVPYKVGSFPFMANSRGRSNSDSDGFVKILSLDSPGELLAPLVLAMKYKASVDDVWKVSTSHPTLQEAVKEACFAASPTTGYKSIHF